jgi:hypothetical protein
MVTLRVGLRSAITSYSRSNEGIRVAGSTSTSLCWRYWSRSRSNSQITATSYTLSGTGAKY